MRLKVCWPLAASLLLLTACPSTPPATTADMTPDQVVVADETPDTPPSTDMQDATPDQGPAEPTAEQKLILDVEARETYELDGLKDTVHVVYTEVEGDLGGLDADHDPVRLDVRDVVKHQARHGVGA